MTRAEVIMRYLAHKAAAKALHDALTADARAEYEEHRTAPTWRLPFATAPTNLEQDGIEVTDEKALLDYLEQTRPDEVVTTRHVRNPDWLKHWLGEAGERGGKERLAVDTDGTVIPGTAWRAGGAFKSVSVTPTTTAAREIRRMAERYANGEGPLEIEGLRIHD